MADGKMIEYRVDNGIAVLEINRPPVNSYTTELLKELDAAILEARFDDNVHAIVLTGKIEKFFSAGADINMLSSKSLSFKNNFALHGHEVLMRLENTPKLVIAAINGHAVGGGLEIAMACDIRIAKKEGGRVGLAEINLGVMPGMGGTQRLPRLVGKARAMELCATGKTIAFEEALDMGLVHYIYERENFMEQIMDYARQFIVPNKSSLAVGKVKRAIQTGLELSLPDGLAFERELLAQAFGSEDGQEGVKAYLEKRMVRYHRRGPRKRAHECVRADQEEQRRNRPAIDTRARQDFIRIRLGNSSPASWFGVLRRSRVQGSRLSRPAAAKGRIRYGRPPAHRHLRRDRAVEFSTDSHGNQARSGIGGGQHDHYQTRQYHSPCNRSDD